MRRVVSVWFPTFPTDRIRRHGNAPPEEAPLVTAARDGNHRIIAAADRAATVLGLRPGMTLAQAQALVPNLSIREGDLAGDAAALVRLAAWCLRYAPLAAADPPDGLWIDITGCAHLHGGEMALLGDLVQRLTSHGLPARAAIADTPAVAHAIARFGGFAISVVPSDDKAALTDLPIEALRLPAEVAASLRLMGFEHVGALVSCFRNSSQFAANGGDQQTIEKEDFLAGTRSSPTVANFRVGTLASPARAPLVRRFGTVLATRLDQAMGTVFEPIVPVVPPKLIQARLSFVEPLLTPAAFSAVIKRLAGLVCTDLEQAGRGARRLDLLFEQVDGGVQAIRVGTARPVRNAHHLARMLDERLEQIDPGLGVDAMRLVVTADDRLNFIQTNVRLTGAEEMSVEGIALDIAPLVDRLINRLGEARVYRIAPVQSDVPERSAYQVPPLSSPLTLPAVSRQGQGWPIDLPRPVRLLDPPQPVEAMALLPDYPPIAFTWRRVRHRVRRADGPERIAGEWWKREGEMRSVRDYFRVEDEDGRRFWLFRRGNGSDEETGDMRWFLHGFF